MRRVTLYSRATCGLCDEAREVLETVRAEAPFDLREILIDGDEALEERYGLRVPVVEIDGEEAFEVRVDASDLRAMLRG